MDAKKLANMIAKIVKLEIKETVSKHLTPIIKKTIREEFNNILQRIEIIEQQKKSTSLENLISNSEPIIKPFQNKKGAIYEILNQTAQERVEQKPINSEQISDQIILTKEQLNQNMDIKNEHPKQYNVPQTQENKQLQTISLPTTSADGRAIDYNKINPNIINRMMKNYSSFLKKTEDKVKINRGN